MSERDPRAAGGPAGPVRGGQARAPPQSPEMPVNYWSNTGQILVEYWSICPLAGQPRRGLGKSAVAV